MRHRIKETVTAGFNFFQVEKEVDGIGWVGCSPSYETREEAESKLPAAPKVKLSPTMQKQMDKLHKADWYYMYNGKTCEHFANEEKRRPIGFEGTGIIEGGFVYAQMDSKTLEALRKRGLVEVAKDGKESLDAVEVVGMELPDRLTKALRVQITRYWGNSKQTFDAFATSKDAVKHLITYFDGPRDVTVTAVEFMGEVELSVWDFKL